MRNSSSRSPSTWARMRRRAPAWRGARSSVPALRPKHPEPKSGVAMPADHLRFRVGRPSEMPWPLVCALMLLSQSVSGQGTAVTPGPTFAISRPLSIHPEELTGRVFLMISHDSEPMHRMGQLDGAQFFGVDVSHVTPGQTTVVNATTLGYPLRSLS